ncbi:MAG: nitrilase [Chloroflexi bacterium]|nr:nitrilase [Chloroflexota bacterium]
MNLVLSFAEVKESLMGLALKLILRWRSRPLLVRAALRGRDFPQPPEPTPGRVRVGVVQLRLHITGDAGRFASAMYRPLREAVAGGAQLVIFPEDTGTCLLGLLPGIGKLAAQAGSLDEAVASAAGQGATVADVFKVVAPGARRAYQAAFSALARRFSVHIVAGSIMLPDEAGRLYNVACLFGPGGRIMGRQRKTHLFHIEQDWGVTPGDQINVFDTPVGKLAFPVCMDHTFFEPQRIAWLLGAEIMVDPSANPEPYQYWEQLRGVWGRVQESPAYGILSCLVGQFMGFTFEGRSGVYAPLEMTPAGDGILAHAETADQEEVILADLDLEALRRFRAEHGPDFNLALVERYFPEVYEEYRPRVAGP